MNQASFPRPAYGESVLVLVPKIEQQFKWQPLIKGGSAIVGFQVEDDKYVIYYEGNLYGAENLKSFRERALVAYGRLTQCAPTIAFSCVDVSEFEVAGTMTNKAFEVTHTQALGEWMSRDVSLVSHW